MVHAPYRIATPPEPIHTEEADTYEKTLVAERVRERFIGASLVLAGLGVTAIAGVTVSNLSHHSAHEAEARVEVEVRLAHGRVVIDDADRAATEAEVAFERAMAQEIEANLGPTMPLTPCNAELTAPDSFTRGRPFPLLVLSGPDDRDLPSPSVAKLRADVQRAQESLLSGNTSEAILYADALAAFPPEARLVRDVVLVPTKRTPPARLSATAFQPGIVEGRAYVYDFRQHRVTCAGLVHATSSRSIEYSWNDGALAAPKAWEHQEPRLDATLDDDLDAQVARAITLPGTLFAVTR